MTEEERTAAAKPGEEANFVKTKPVAKAKQEAAPVAVPVVTAEEAEKLNEEAKEYEKVWKRKSDKTILEGKVLTISGCPNPADIDYPDCNLTLSVTINDSRHSTVKLVTPCIRGSKIVINRQIQKDSLVAFKLIEEDTITEQEKSIQISDDDPDFELDYCYVKDLQLIEYYSKISVYHSKEMKEIVYDTKMPLTEDDEIVRKQYLESELNRLNKVISNYSSEDAKTFCSKLLNLTKDIGENNHPYVELELDDGTKKIMPIQSYVPPNYFLNAAFVDTSDLMQHNARIIASVNSFLKEKGILLIVVPVPQAFESFADRFNLSKHLSTYNWNRVQFMRHLLMQDVEVLDIEPLVERTLYSHFYFFDVLDKDQHPTPEGALCISQYLFEHLNRYQFTKNILRNNYDVQITRENIQKKYYELNVENIERLSFNPVSNPNDKDSPILLVGDSFSMGQMSRCLAATFKTKINEINATSSYPSTTRLLQMRKQEISPSTKICFLINSSLDLCHRFVPFIDDDIILFPNETLFPDKDFYAEGKDLQDKISIEFDIDLSQFIANSNNYRIVFYVSSTARQLYELEINSLAPQKGSSRWTGHGAVECSLPQGSNMLHVELSTSPEGGHPICDNQNLTLRIDKILLIEE